MTKLSHNDPAPDFVLASSEGQRSLKDYHGAWVVLYFYPKDFTPGCTQQACDFRDRQDQLDANVIGISPDPLEQHKAFIAEHGLNYELLSDPDFEVAKRYGAYGEKKNYGKVYEGLIRSTFIIDPEGKIAKAMVNVKATGHVERVAKELEKLQA